jgi:FKBP-type peptidyl-prolyl cis-trans isomerase FkpA
MFKTVVIAVLTSASLAIAAPDAGTEKSKPKAEKAGDAKEVKTGDAKEVKTASGLGYTELKPGKGPSPTATDKVKVNYRGTLTDGTEFDSSYKRGQPAEFPLNRVIPCWTEGVQKMKVGGKAKLTCPASIAYGDRGAGGVIPPGATLIFEIELLSIEK